MFKFEINLTLLKKTISGSVILIFTNKTTTVGYPTQKIIIMKPTVTPQNVCV